MEVSPGNVLVVGGHMATPLSVLFMILHFCPMLTHKVSPLQCSTVALMNAMLVNVQCNACINSKCVYSRATGR